MEAKKDFHRRDVLTDIYRNKAIINGYYPVVALEGLLYRASGKEASGAAIRKKIKNLGIPVKSVQGIYGEQISGVVKQKYIDFEDLRSLFREILGKYYKEKSLNAFLEEEGSAASEWLRSRDIEI